MTGSGGAGAGAGAGATGSGGAGGIAGPPGSGGSGPEVTAPVIVPRVARLSHFQWRNAVQDLLRLDAAPEQSASFPPDATLGFDNNASQLRMSTALHDAYQSAAETLAAQVAGNATALAKLLPAGAPTEATARAKAFIQSFGQRAYRRPLTTAEVDQHLALFQKGPQLAPELDAFAAGALVTIQMVLQSPLFLYRTELGQQTVAGRIQLSGHELAARLSFAVTGTIPDDTLLQAATAGSLDPANAKASLETQAQRLLETPRAKASSLHLHTQALALSRYATIQRDKVNYPEYADSTPASLRRSAELFFDAIFAENLGVKAILTSPNAFVDSNVAKLYGLTGTFGTEFTKVDVSTKSRRGFLTQAGFLALFSGEHQPDPIHRGVFINEQILCQSVGVPVANLPPLPTPQAGQTNRQVIDSITGAGTCGQACHATMINPLGFAFENYDPLGRYRTKDNGNDVNASGSYVFDGASRSFQNALELTQLLSESQAAHRCYASQWLAYLYGRPASSADAAILNDVATRSKAQDLSTKDMIRGLLNGESFLTRSAGE